MSFSSLLIRWYHRHKRPLPWRDTRNAYHIWLSEVILQQTRVEQGLPYFERFIKKYPTVELLAAATEEEVLKLWQGLGYYSRARNMLATARIITSQHRGMFPQTAAELEQLKGIGPYTAAAIASFAFREAVPVVDGNVFRVLSRYLGIDTPVNSAAARQVFTEAAAQLMDTRHPDDFNQAMMEFGALHCTPQKPQCTACVLADTCAALHTGRTEMLPVKNKKTPPSHRYFTYLLIEEGTHTYIRQRQGNDIWRNLFELPLIETPKPCTEDELFTHPEFAEWLPQGTFVVTAPPHETRHILSHRIINARFIRLKIKRPNKTLSTHFQRIKMSQLGTFPIPRILDIYLKDLNLI